MTARNPADRKPATCNCTMLFDSLHGVRRTGWIITARRWKERRDQKLIAANAYQHGIFHLEPTDSLLSCRHTMSISLLSCSKVAVYALDSERMTMSTPSASGMIRMRANSLKRLRRRLRSTMLWPCFETTTATLACKKGEPLARTSKWSVRSRFPAFFTCSRSDSLVSR